MSNLTVRQEYAKAAMQAYIGLTGYPQQQVLTTMLMERANEGDTLEDLVSENSFRWSDAMIRYEKAHPEQ